MNTSIRHGLGHAWLLAACLLFGTAFAQNPPAPPAPAAPTGQVEAPDPANAAPAVEAPDAGDNASDADAVDADHNASNDSNKGSSRRRNRGHHNDDDVVMIGGNAHLERGKVADTVVSVFGSSTAEGDVRDAVVSVFGDTTVLGKAVDAVAVMGSVELNGQASGDVVAVMGNVKLGPNADVKGNVVVVGGTLERAEGSVIHGGVQNVFGFTSDWIRPWIRHCLVYLRPLALTPGIGWAWTLTLGFFALYLLIAVVARESVDRCVQVLEEHPGRSIVAALLSMLGTPILLTVLCITVIGIALVPFAILGAYFVSVFGKAVMLAWIGKKVLRGVNKEQPAHTLLAVFIGGVIVIALYLVPVVGFIVYKGLAILGFGVVIYTMILALQARRTDSVPPPSSTGSGGAYAGTAAGGGFGSPGGDAPSYAAGAGAAAGSAAFSAGTAEPSSASQSSPPGGSAQSPNSDSPGAAPGYSSGSTPPPPPPPPHYGSGASAQPPRSEAEEIQANLLAVSTYPRATFWVRMVALFIDAVLIGIVLGIFSHNHQAELIALATYGAVMWKLKGTTIGGIVFGMKVLRLDGRPLDWPTATVRALSCFLSLVVAGLGFFWILFDEGRQGWHDKIAGTVVVRVPKGISLL